MNLGELDLIAAESKATYGELKTYVLERTELKVSVGLSMKCYKKKKRISLENARIRDAYKQ